MIVSATDCESDNEQESTTPLLDNQRVEQQQLEEGGGGDIEEEGGDGEGCSISCDERAPVGVQETAGEDIEKIISSVFKEELSGT